VLWTLLNAPEPAAVRGHAQYLLKQNAALRRSVTERWGRGLPRWSQLDGLTRSSPAIRPALAQWGIGAALLNRPENTLKNSAMCTLWVGTNDPALFI